MRWVLAHCSVQNGPRAKVHTGAGVDRRYICTPADAGA
jgi:hypothetical protein